MQKIDIHERHSELCVTLIMTSKPCRACVGFGHTYDISVRYGPCTRSPYEKHVIEERVDCKVCNGSGQQPVPLIRVTDDLEMAEDILGDTPNGYNEHLWLIKVDPRTNLVLSIVLYGMRTNCGIFYCSEEWFNAKRPAGFGGEKSPTLEQLLADGYKVVYWTHDGGRQDGWFRKEMIYYAKLVE